MEQLRHTDENLVSAPIDNGRTHGRWAWWITADPIERQQDAQRRRKVALAHVGRACAVIESGLHASTLDADDAYLHIQLAAVVATLARLNA